MRFPHRANGYCRRCYQLITKKSQIQKWNLDDPKSLKGYIMNMSFWKPDIMKAVQVERLKKIESHLADLKFREERLSEDIDGEDIERGLTSLAKQCKCRRHESIFAGYRAVIDDNFDLPQKKILFGIINAIEEALPWRLR